jgi:hypothetical protein
MRAIHKKNPHVHIIPFTIDRHIEKSISLAAAGAMIESCVRQ